MKIIFNLSNRAIYTLIAFGIFILAGIGVWAYTNSIPNPGHGGDTVWVSIGGTEKTLQQAIDDGDFGEISETNTPDYESDWINISSYSSNKDYQGIIVHNLNTDKFSNFQYIIRKGPGANENDEVIYQGMDTSSNMYIGGANNYWAYGIGFYIDKSDDPTNKIKWVIARHGPVYAPYYDVPSYNKNWGYNLETGQMKVRIWK